MAQFQGSGRRNPPPFFSACHFLEFSFPSHKAAFSFSPKALEYSFQPDPGKVARPGRCTATYVVRCEWVSVRARESISAPPLRRVWKGPFSRSSSGREPVQGTKKRNLLTRAVMGVPGIPWNSRIPRRRDKYCVPGIARRRDKYCVPGIGEISIVSPESAESPESARIRKAL